MQSVLRLSLAKISSPGLKKLLNYVVGVELEVVEDKPDLPPFLQDYQTMKLKGIRGDMDDSRFSVVVTNPKPSDHVEVLVVLCD